MDKKQFEIANRFLTEEYELTGVDKYLNDNNKIDKSRPIFFQSTHYRLPTKEECEDINKYNLKCEDIYKGFCYNMVGRGMLWQEQKDKIINACKMMVDLFPDNLEYKKCLEKANNIKVDRS